MSQFYKRYQFDKQLIKEIQRLSTLDNIHGPLAVFIDILLIGITFFVILTSHWMLYPFGLLVIGSRQRALATILHEAAHGTLTKHRKLGYLLGTFFSGYLIFSSYSAYHQSHLRSHHGHFGDPKKDDDYRYMLTKKVYDTMLPSLYIQRLFTIPCLLLLIPGHHFYFLIKSRLVASNKYGKHELWMIIFYWLIIMTFIIHFNLLWTFILLWIVPYLTFFQIISWFIELSEHSPLMQNTVNLYMTRNRNSYWLEKMFTGMHAESYHLAHHLFPSVPFWKIKNVHQLLLRDSDYAKWDELNGGIFLSANGAPSVMSILKEYIQFRNSGSTHDLKLFRRYGT